MSHREQAFRQLLAAAGIRSVLALQHATGVSRYTIDNAVKGRRRATKSTIAKLAAGLGVPAGVLGEILGAGR